MKNTDKIVAQAREWAKLSCTLAEIDGANLSTLWHTRFVWDRACDMVLELEKQYHDAKAFYAEQVSQNPARREYAETQVRNFRSAWTRAEGACNAITGLVRLWSAAEGFPMRTIDARTGDGVRCGFLDCARGLGLVFSPCMPDFPLDEIGISAEAGAAVLFARLMREEGVA